MDPRHDAADLAEVDQYHSQASALLDQMIDDVTQHGKDGCRCGDDPARLWYATADRLHDAAIEYDNTVGDARNVLVGVLAAALVRLVGLGDMPTGG